MQEQTVQITCQCRQNSFHFRRSKQNIAECIFLDRFVCMPVCVAARMRYYKCTCNELLQSPLSTPTRLRRLTMRMRTFQGQDVSVASEALLFRRLLKLEQSDLLATAANIVYLARVAVDMLMKNVLRIVCKRFVGFIEKT